MSFFLDEWLIDIQKMQTFNILSEAPKFFPSLFFFFFRINK